MPVPVRSPMIPRLYAGRRQRQVGALTLRPRSSAVSCSPRPNAVGGQPLAHGRQQLGECFRHRVVAASDSYGKGVLLPNGLPASHGRFFNDSIMQGKKARSNSQLGGKVGGEAVLPHHGVEVRTLHAHVAGRPADVAVAALQRFGQETPLNLLARRVPHLLLELLELLPFLGQGHDRRLVGNLADLGR